MSQPLDRSDLDVDSPIAAVSAFDLAMAEPGDDLPSLARRMHDSDIGALLVRGHDGEVGIVTERDVVRALAEDEWSWAVDCMTRDLIVVSADTSIGDAAELLITAGVRHLVVEQEDGTIGVASMRDLLGPILDSTD